MRELAPIVLIAIVPTIIALFLFLPARRAIAAGIIGGNLFAPWFSFDVEGLPPFDRFSVISLGVASGAMLFDSSALRRTKLRWWDAALLVFVFCPVATSLSNGLGLYDGLSTSFRVLILWGIPYLLGRAYVRNLAHVRELAEAIVLGGLVYTPFCLWEIIMSPRLHKIIYGYRQHSFGQTRRLGGWRPMVFMQHGLAVGLLMAVCALTAYWLWRGGRRPGGVRTILGKPASWSAVTLIVVTILCKSTLAILLMFLGIVLLEAMRRRRGRAPMIALLLVAPLYVTLRGSGVWDGQLLIDWAGAFGADRVESIQTRVESERILAAHACERPILGWGGHSRSKVLDDRGRSLAVTDAYWIAVFGQNGIIGLVALVVTLSLPGFLILRRSRRGPLALAVPPPLLVLSVVPTIWMIDNLFNAMPDQIFILASGATMSVLVSPARRRPPGPGRRALITAPPEPAA